MTFENAISQSSHIDRSWKEKAHDDVSNDTYDKHDYNNKLTQW